MFNKLIKPFQHIPNSPGQLWIVGGAVRDTLMGFEPSDIDFVVVGSVHTIKTLFNQTPVPVHNDAPVYTVKLNGEIFEVALARTETSTGQGSEGFAFELVESNIEIDLARRDFAVNAIAVDVFNGDVIDPFGGMDDIADNVLRHVSDRFVESPERVGRAAMMIARFGLVPSMALHAVCGMMVPEFAAIPPEQMWKQFLGKMLRKGVHFDKAFLFLDIIEALAVSPIFQAMRDCPQSPVHHPEGDVLTHTILTLHHASRIGADLVVRSTILMHDMGKPATTVIDEDGKITAHGHEHHHEPIIRFMDRIGFPHAMRRQVLGLISVHMRKSDIPNKRSQARLLRKLAEFGVTVEQFEQVIECDVNGRGTGDVPLPDDVMKFVEFAANFEPEQADQHARPLVTGHELIEIGFQPGKALGMVLDAIGEGFLVGEIETKEDALEFARLELDFA